MSVCTNGRASFFSSCLKDALETLTNLKKDGHEAFCGREINNLIELLSPKPDSALKYEPIYEARDWLISISRSLEASDKLLLRKLDVLLSLLDLMYTNQQYFSKRLFIESAHLKVIQKFLSLGLHKMAYEHVSYILDGLEIISTVPPCTKELNPALSESQEFQCYRSLVVSCWLCLLLAVTELDDESGLFLSSITVVSSCVKSMQLWIDAGIVSEKHISLVCRYVIRIIDRFVQPRYTAHMLDADVIAISGFVFSACSRSNSGQQLPYLVRRLAQNLNFTEFTQSFARASPSTIRSIETEKWLVELEHLGMRASKQGLQSKDVRIMYLIGEATGINLESVSFVQIIFLGLSLTGLCIPDDGEQLEKWIRNSRKNFEHILSQGCDASDVPRITRALDIFSCGCMKYLQEVVFRAASIHSPHLIGLLVENMVLFVDAIYNMMSVTGGNFSDSLFRKCMLNLSLTQVTLLRAYCTLTCGESEIDKEYMVSKMFSKAVKVLESDHSKIVKMALKQTTVQLLKKFSTKSASFTMRLYCAFCSMITQDMYSDPELDEISECLITFNDTCITKGMPHMAFQTSVTQLLQFRGQPQLRYLYNFELARCLCKVPESLIQPLCLEVFERNHDHELSVSAFQDLLIEHLSVWNEILRLKAPHSADLVALESKLAITLCTALCILEANETVDYKILNEILESLLFLLRRQCKRQQCDCLKPSLLRQVLAMTNENWNINEFVKQHLCLTTKCIEIKACVLSILTGQEIGDTEYMDMKIRIDELSKESNDAYAQFARQVTAKQSHEIFACVKESWINLIVTLVSIFHKLNLFDEFEQAACISSSILKMTGMRLETRSYASNIITFPISASNESLLKQDSVPVWCIQFSDFEVRVRMKIIEVCVYVTNGDLSSAFEYNTQVLNLVELVLKSYSLPYIHTGDMEAWNNEEIHSQLQNSIHYDGLTVSFAISLWQIIGLYLEIKTFHAIIMYWLGIYKPSNNSFGEALCISQRMNLPYLTAAINIRQARHLIERSLMNDAERLMHSVETLLRKARLRVTLTQLLHEALDVSLLALNCSIHHARGDASSGKIAYDALVTNLTQMMDSRDIENFTKRRSTWYIWCSFMLSRSAIDVSMYMDVNSAELLLMKSEDWMSSASLTSTVDSACSLLARSALNVRKLRKMLQTVDCCASESHKIYHETVEMLLSALELWDCSPYFVKKSAILYGALVSSTSVNTEGLTHAAHESYSASFRQRAAIDIPESALSDASASLRSKILDPEVQAHAEFPIVTLGESCLSAAFFGYDQGVAKTLMLTRCSCLASETPITIELPWPEVKYSDSVQNDMFEHFKEILNHARSCSCSEKLTRAERVAWWEERLLRDHQLHQLLISLQRDVFGPFVFLMFGEPEAHEVKESSTTLAQILSELQHVSERRGIELQKFSRHLLRLMLQYIDELRVEEISSVLRRTFIVSDSTSKQLGLLSNYAQLEREIYALAEYCKSLNCGKKRSKSKDTNIHHSTFGPIYLLLDDKVASLPWESMPKLVQHQFFRIPCVTYSDSRVINQEKYRNSHSCFDLAKTSILLNPSGDLLSTEQALTRFVVTNEEWKSITPHDLQPQHVSDILATSDLFLYFGHGSGKQYVFNSVVSNKVLYAVVVLMGCSSGAVVRLEGDLEPDGDILTYLLSGVPSILANLWDVTDRDIDRFSVNLLDTWMDGCSKDGTYSFAAASHARDSCRLRWLTGAAPIFFGSPVFLKDSRVHRSVATKK
mmetsp:Transcript_181/g.513  ORF Transcript_181/g.513 Transcript_181/m.513 type:complete len:1748 (+) Transcript_181:245-5488(+)